LHTDNITTKDTNPSALLKITGAFTKLEKRALLLSVQSHSPLGKAPRFWENVSAYMLSQFCIIRSINSCKLNWLRHISAEFGYDERLGEFIPGGSPRSAYEKLRRSKNGPVATPKPKKRKSSESDEMKPLKKSKKKLNSQSPDETSESEYASGSEYKHGPEATSSSVLEAASTPEPDETSCEDSDETLSAVEVVEKETAAPEDETETDLYPVEQEDETVPALELDDETDEEEDEDEDEEYCRELFLGPQIGMSSKEKRLRKQLLNMLVESRRYESDEVTMSRELRWHREMTWAKFQTPWYAEYAT
jgi:hypothetical protein